MKNILNSTTFLAIVACWLWSTAFVGVKIGLDYQSPFQFAGIRFFISGVLIFLYYGKFKNYFSELKRNWKFILRLGLVQIFAQYALFYSGIDLVPSAFAAMIIGSSPLFIAVVAHLAENCICARKNVGLSVECDLQQCLTSMAQTRLSLPLRTKWTK